MDSINDFPVEILIEIFKNTGELPKLTSVCKLWRSVVEENLVFPSNKFFAKNTDKASTEVAENSIRRFKDFVIIKDKLREDEHESLCRILKRNEKFLKTCNFRVNRITASKLTEILENLKNVKKLTIEVKAVINFDIWDDTTKPATLDKLTFLHAICNHQCLASFKAPNLQTFVYQNDEFELHGANSWKFIQENEKNINHLEIFGIHCNVQICRHQLIIKLLQDPIILNLLNEFCEHRYKLIQKLSIYNYTFDGSILEDIIKKSTSLKTIDFRSYNFDFGSIFQKSYTVTKLMCWANETSEEHVMQLGHVFPNIEYLYIKYGKLINDHITPVVTSAFRNLKKLKLKKYM